MEFVGKFHTKFAGLRFILEFKYFSNAEWKKSKKKISAFKLIEKDKNQVKGYEEALKKEETKANTQSFVSETKDSESFLYKERGIINFLVP